jgi:hypothetical protein
MPIFQTLQELETFSEKKSSAPMGDGVSRYLKINDKEAYKLRFRQELTLDGENYDDVRGAAHYVHILSSPTDFRKSR